MSTEVNIFDSTAKKVFYGGGSRFWGTMPVMGLVVFVGNHCIDESWNSRKDSNVKLTDKERMATHYFRWRELTVSSALTAAILFIILFASPDISTAVKVKLAIAGGAIGFTSIITGYIAYYYRRKALGSNTIIHPNKPSGNVEGDL